MFQSCQKDSCGFVEETCMVYVPDFLFMVNAKPHNAVHSNSALENEAPPAIDIMTIYRYYHSTMYQNYKIHSALRNKLYRYFFVVLFHEKR